MAEKDRISVEMRRLGASLIEDFRDALPAEELTVRLRMIGEFDPQLLEQVVDRDRSFPGERGRPRTG
jgi:hypothetical protein